MPDAQHAPDPPQPMGRRHLQHTLRAHAGELHRLGVAHLSLFGSAARDEAGAGSDVDLLIEVLPGRAFSLWALGETRVRLGEILGREVDVLIAQDIGAELRRRIAADLVPVF